MTWTPLITGEEADSARNTVSEVLHGLHSGRRDAGFGLNGYAGHAILFSYAHAARLEGNLDRAAAGLLDKSISLLIAGPANISLWSGIAGVRWALAHLNGDAATEEAVEKIDATILAALDRWNGSYDLLDGLVGIGVAALESLHRPTAQAVIARVIDELELLARHEPAGLAWYTPADLLPSYDRTMFPAGFFNLGIAHGVSGVIGFCALLCRTGFEARRARVLLEGAMQWLLSVPQSAGAGRFPIRLGPGVFDRSDRLAWCQGDVGVAVSLMAAVTATDEAVWKHDALAIARVIASRRPNQSGVVESSFCHGAAGIAHILNRLYHATGDHDIGTAARQWMARVISLWRGNPSDDGTILRGAAGIALVLLAATTDIPPDWDRIVLCDLCDLQGARSFAQAWLV